MDISDFDCLSSSSLSKIRGILDSIPIIFGAKPLKTVISQLICISNISYLYRTFSHPYNNFYSHWICSKKDIIMIRPSLSNRIQTMLIRIRLLTKNRIRNDYSKFRSFTNFIQGWIQLFQKSCLNLSLLSLLYFCLYLSVYIEESLYEDEQYSLDL